MHTLLIAWAFIGPSAGVIAGCFWCGAYRTRSEFPDNIMHEGYSEADRAWKDYQDTCKREADEAGIK